MPRASSWGFVLGIISSSHQYDKIFFNNMRRAAYRQVRNYVGSKLGVSNYRLRLDEAIRLFASDNNLAIIGDSNKWIINLYISGNNDHIKRIDVGFYRSPEWLKIRKLVIAKYGTTCMKCGCECNPVHVDHIKPRSKFKHLELSFDNLQILCCLCNGAKSNRNSIDYRTPYHVNGKSNDFGYGLMGLERGIGYKATMMPRTNMDTYRAAGSLSK